jgi:electron transfer flavoprotein alpha/beta subunit
LVYALSPDTVQESLRKAMSMGADRAVHPPQGRRRSHLTVLPSPRLSLPRLASGGVYDLTSLFGKHAFDSSAGVTSGTAVAELLRPAHVSRPRPSSRSRMAPAWRGATRGALQKCTFPLPAVITIDEACAAYPSLKGHHGRQEETALESKPTRSSAPDACHRPEGETAS